MKLVAALLVAGSLCAATDYASADDAKTIVAVETGTLAGAKVGTVDVFKGIPYAAPPIGALRWEAPAPPANWAGTRAAATFGAICPQPPRDTVGAIGADQQQSEDCLFLNVWSFDEAKKAPVMVWIHGGAFRFGSGSARFNDGADFAKDGVILVTLNYRLGALGFFAHPALTKAATPDAALGNYGITDQIAALNWVKRNIAAFGGDPHNVTVFGESAGGVSVLTLLTTPAAKGLFTKAIVESGGGWEAQRTLAEQEQNGITLASAAGLGAGATLAELRALPPEKLFNLPMRIGGVGPVVDGRLVKEGVAQAFAAGHESHVPLVIGSNSDEASLMKTFTIPAAAIFARVPPAVRALYPGSDEDVAAAIFTDSAFGAPARWIAAQASGGAPAFLYHFSYVPTAQRGFATGARHGGEIPFVFGSWPGAFDGNASTDDHAMESLMHACWVAFAKTSKPVCGEKAWPAYTPATDELMEFGAQPGPAADSRKAKYDELQRAILPRLFAGK